MTTAAQQNWRNEFGVAESKPPRFFSGKDDLDSTTPQGHLIRRAFDVLKVDGVLCVDHSPLAYFKVVKQITPQAVVELHRQFWNHGGAALLIVVTDDRVHIYSSMTPPDRETGGSVAPPSEVEPALPRLAEKLQTLILAVESGEYFHKHRKSFDPKNRVDRHLLDNLRHTRENLLNAARKPIPAPVLNALLCRLVFTCYLFDREVIGERYLSDLGIAAKDLRSLLANPSAAKVRSDLYKLFDKLKDEFNGDVFSDDLSAEKKFVVDDHMNALSTFIEGMSIPGGQGVLFRVYDFKYIPIETISAIYERFLNEAERKKGAFYTPRFLAEVVLDTALDGYGSLLGKRFLDPACGSGIFLVGLFNRIAEEWKQANPGARNYRKAKELMRLMQESLYGVDVSLTACRITAFSLYLAYLDQLSSPDIQALKDKGRALPRLVIPKNNDDNNAVGLNIREADFFTSGVDFPIDVNLVIGNPPWGGKASRGTLAVHWCQARGEAIPNKQIATAFIWKASDHVAKDGRICFVLPHGVLFNHSDKAIEFQAAWVKRNAIERVINLADLRRILFEKAIHPAIVVSYRPEPPLNNAHRIEYWSPKADWTVTKTEVISVSAQDRNSITVGALLQDLAEPDAPQIWKRHFWATPRDWRLLDRLALYPRLREVASQTTESSEKPWRIATGLRTFGDNDPESTRTAYELPTSNFIRTESHSIDLFLLESDCKKLESRMVEVRRNHQSPEVFTGPHVLFNKGFTQAAFADCDVAFLEAVRGIHGPQKDRNLLVFLATYLRSRIARYFLFHTASNLGIYRPEAHVDEVLRLPFPLPGQLRNEKRATQIIETVVKKVDDATREASADWADRQRIVTDATTEIEPLIEEYFDITPAEKELIRDTVQIVLESIQPARGTKVIKTLAPAPQQMRRAYCDRVCGILTKLLKDNTYIVRGDEIASELTGVGVAAFERVERAKSSEPFTGLDRELLNTLDTVRKLIPKTHSTLDIVRGVMVFDGPRLYLVKPISQRFWTRTAAMNDADEIASTILMPSPKGDA